ncbi:hypothetical protein [Winogradskyella schleiferi]|uniref:hypothetical protein n=1 Tax=Winogradskyella schleiferi TaxID=2686078 RepID=UPI0015BF3B1F|nr:hypothetical protein [Winogradskyella schleiferi]
MYKGSTINMEFIYLIITGIVAVSMMTLFSIIWGNITNNLFSEPKLLTIVIKKTYKKKKSLRTAQLLGWIFHFLIGFIFLGLYELLWRVLDCEKSILLSIPLGIFSGILGVIGWMILYKLIDFTAKFNYTHYYIHLIFAHIVFSVTAVFVYLSLEALG